MLVACVLPRSRSCGIKRALNTDQVLWHSQYPLPCGGQHPSLSFKLSNCSGTRRPAIS